MTARKIWSGFPSGAFLIASLMPILARVRLVVLLQKDHAVTVLARSILRASSVTWSGANSGKRSLNVCSICFR